MKRRRIYTLNGLPPEVVAVAFAKSSRSPEPFDEIARELNEDKSSKFHEKWVVGYGHSSVAEHAVLSLAIENVSILATKVIEDNRLASYTEKSTRYQVFDSDSYYKPENVMGSPVGTLYEETADFLFQSYASMIEDMVYWVKKNHPRKDQPESLYEIQVRNRALDNIRYVLPVATLTNLGMTVNARSLEHAAVKLLSSPLEEMQDIGNEIKEAAVKVTPTLIKYVRPNPYLKCASGSIAETTKIGSQEGQEKSMVELVEYDTDAEDKVIAALIYRCSESSYADVRQKVSGMQKEDREKVIDAALTKMDRFDWPIRELEHTYYTFDILMDYGAFRDIQRHRMATQTNQAVTTLHGYDIPDDIISAGQKTRYIVCMEKAKVAFDRIGSIYPEEAQYIVPLAFRKRTLFKCNLRELYHLIKLRSGKMGHISYRRIAQQMYDLVREKHPLLAKYIIVDKS